MTARRWTAATLLTALALPALAVPAGAVQDPTTGYWTRTRTGVPVPVQPPSPVPEGGFWVSRDPVGPVAVSAIRVAADEGSVIAGFRLPVDEVIGTPAILVCPTSERWAPEQGGRLEAAPLADCSSPVEAAVQDALLVIALPAALQGEVVDVLLTPAEGSTFSATFQRAAAEAVVQAPAPAQPAPPAPAPAPAPQSGGGVAAPPAFDGGGSGDVSGGLSGGFSGGGDLAVPDLGAPGAAPEPLLPPPVLPAEAQAPVPQPQAAPLAFPGTVAARPAAVPVDRTASLLAVAVLAGLVALALRLAVQPAAAPRHLGGGARLSRGVAAGGSAAALPARAPGAAPAAGVAAPERGVGRFRSARGRPPVRI